RNRGHGWHLLAGLFVGGGERPAAPADSPVAGNLRRARRRGCWFARSHGRGDLATGEDCDYGSDDDRHLCGERSRAAAFPRELGVADRRRRRRRLGSAGGALAGSVRTRAEMGLRLFFILYEGEVKIGNSALFARSTVVTVGLVLHQRRVS